MSFVYAPKGFQGIVVVGTLNGNTVPPKSWLQSMKLKVSEITGLRWERRDVKTCLLEG